MVARQKVRIVTLATGAVSRPVPARNAAWNGNRGIVTLLWNDKLSVYDLRARLLRDVALDLDRFRYQRIDGIDAQNQRAVLTVSGRPGNETQSLAIGLFDLSGASTPEVWWDGRSLDRFAALSPTE